MAFPHKQVNQSEGKLGGQWIMDRSLAGHVVPCGVVPTVPHWPEASDKISGSCFHRLFVIISWCCMQETVLDQVHEDLVHSGFSSSTQCDIHLLLACSTVHGRIKESSVWREGCEIDTVVPLRGSHHLQLSPLSTVTVCGATQKPPRCPIISCSNVYYIKYTQKSKKATHTRNNKTKAVDFCIIKQAF